jgi:signal transduction histidine kinase
MASRGAPFSSYRSRATTDAVRGTVASRTFSLTQFSRNPLIAVLVAISYYLGAQIGFFLTPAHSPIETFWPPNAILLAAFLLAPPRMWWTFLLAVLPVHLLIHLRIGVPLSPTLGWFFWNGCQSLIAATCMLYFNRGKRLFDSVRGVSVFLVFGVLLPALVTSLLDAAMNALTQRGVGDWTIWTTRLSSSIIAQLTVVPAIVILGQHGIAWFRKTSFVKVFEAGLLAVAIVFVSALVFGSSTTSRIPALIYAPLPLLIWSTVRFGAGAVSASSLVVTLISVWNAMHGRGLLTAASLANDVLSLHALLAAFTWPFLLMAALISDRRRTDESLRHSRNKLIQAQEQDHYRIARGLRDDIVQQITLVGLNLEQIREESEPSAKARLDKLYDQISDVSEATRDLSQNLYPFAVEYLGLASALRKLCRDTGALSGIAITFKEESAPISIPADVSRRLYSVAHEALRNIVRHSGARHAALELGVSSGRVQLRIVDDGVGMNPERGDGIGLTSMREQLLSLGGTFTIRSAPSAGTTIEAAVPISRPS